MILKKGEIIKLSNNEFNGCKKTRINSINKSVEKNVFDLTTESGFFNDVNGIVHKQCHGANLEYVKKHGLKLTTVNSVSNSAKSASVLVNHLLTFASTVQTQYAGAIGFDAINTFFAPYLVGLSGKEIYQVAQELTYGLSQLAGVKGGQCIFSDLNVHIEVPNHLKETKALGPKGKYCKIINSYGNDVIVEAEKENASTYGEFNKYAQKFLIACMDVLKEGDSRGLPFVFPKFLIHFDKNSFKDDNINVVNAVYECASKNGSPYFLFDRGDSVKVAQCCRLSLDMTQDDFDKIKDRPEDVRFSAIQNITINMPQSALKANFELSDKSIEEKKKETVKNIKAAMDIAIMAHHQKKKYLKKIYDIDGGVLTFSKIGMDNSPYVDMNNLTYLIGIIGLNETVQAITGKQLHESEESYNLGLYIIAEMNLYCKKLAKDNEMKLVLEESPAECLHGDELITTISEDGIDFKKIKNIVSDYKNGSEINVFGFDEEGNCIPRKVIGCVKHDKQDIYKVRLSKSIVKATENHRFFSLDDSLNIKEVFCKDLKKEDFLLSPKKIDIKEDYEKIDLLENPVFLEKLYAHFEDIDYFESKMIDNKNEIIKNIGRDSYRYCLKNKRVPVFIANMFSFDKNIQKISCNSIKKFNRVIDRTYKLGYLLGQYIAEGTRGGDIWCGTNKEEAIKVNTYLKDVFGIICKIRKNLYRKEKHHKPMYSICLSKNIFANTYGTLLNDKNELSGKKTVPNFIYNSKDDVKIGFINGYIAGDGTIKDIESDYCISAESTSKKLICGLNFLLKTIGISSICFPVRIFDNEKWNDVYKIKIFGHKKITELGYNLLSKKTNNSGERIPTIVFNSLREKRDLFEDSLKKCCNDKKISYSIYEILTDSKARSFITEESATKGLFDLENITNNKELLGIINKAKSIIEKFDFHFVKSVDFYSKDYVYDISVEGKENFVLSYGSLYSHNSASQRLCHISIKNKKWGEKAFEIAKGDKDNMNCYWTNSIHIDNDADIDYIERLEKQSKFHPLINGGSIVHLWTGEHLPSPQSISSLVKKVYEKTQCTQFTISPEFCVCEDCNNFNLGLDKKCKKCGSEKVSWYSRIVGYFAKIQNWSKNKQEERLSRKKDYSKEW